jgi:hypothetical protein
MTDPDPVRGRQDGPRRCQPPVSQRPRFARSRDHRNAALMTLPADRDEFARVMVDKLD